MVSLPRRYTFLRNSCFQFNFRTLFWPWVDGKSRIIGPPTLEDTNSSYHIDLHVCLGQLPFQQFLQLIITKCMRVDDLTIDAIIKKYEHRQNRILSQTPHQKNTEGNTGVVRAREDLGASGLSTPEFSSAVGRKEINKKLEDAEEGQIQYTHKKQDHLRVQEQAGMSFSTEKKDLEAVLRQLEQTEQRLARSERNFAEASRRCQQLQRQGREAQMQGKLRIHQTGELQSRIAVLQRQNLNYRECLSTKDSNITILRQKLKQKNERLIQCERTASELKSQLAVVTAGAQKAKEEEEDRQRDKEGIVSRLKSQMAKMENAVNERQAERRALLEEMERSYRAHQQELQVVRKSYVQVEEEYKQWIDSCNAEKLTLITEYQRKLAQARATAQNSPALKVFPAFDDELSRREKESNRLITLTAKQAGDLKQLRGDLQNAEKAKNELILKVSSLQNALIDKTEVLGSLEVAYSKLVEQHRGEEQRCRELREKYNSVSHQFVQLKSKCAVLFESLEQNKRGVESENAELNRLRKELMVCREQLQRSRNNQNALGVKLAEATRAVKERLSKLEQEREESLTELLAERLQNARLQEELQETRQHLKREYDLSVQNTKKELERQLQQAHSKTSRGHDPEKEQLYLQLRALQRKYQLLANEIVTVDEVMDIADKVKRRHEPLKKSVLRT